MTIRECLPPLTRAGISQPVAGLRGAREQPNRKGTQR